MLKNSVIKPLCKAVHLLLCATGVVFTSVFVYSFLSSLQLTEFGEDGQLVPGVQSHHQPLAHDGPSAQLPAEQGCISLCYYVLPHLNSTDELQPEGLDLLLCSHLVVVATGSRILNDTIQLARPVDAELIRRVVALKAHNPRLRVLLSLMLGFPQLVHNHTAVISFAYKARMFVEQHALDGLDLDWEFPAWSPDPHTAEKALFVTLLDKLSTALRLVQPAYLITVAVSGIQPYLDHSYDIPGIARNADFISLMGYDYHMYKSYLPFTGHNAPLTPRRTDVGYFASLNVEASVAALEERGLRRSQLLVGVPMYGRTWRLASPRYRNLGSLAVGEGFGDGYVSYTGAWAFAHSADLVVMDEEAAVPYAVRGTDWISYENLQSITAKANFIKKSGVAGVMTFHVGCDDWAGVTGARFPLHSALRRVLCCCPTPPAHSLPHGAPVSAELPVLGHRHHLINATDAD